MIIQANFEHPMNVSKFSKQDSLHVTLLNPQLFVSLSTKQSLKQVQGPMISKVPKQLPKGVSIKSLKKTGTSVNSSINAVVIIKILSQIFFKSIMQDLLQLYIALQFLAYLSNYSMPYPSSASIFQKFLISLIEFKNLNPFNIYRMFNPKFDQKELFINKEV